MVHVLGAQPSSADGLVGLALVPRLGDGGHEYVLVDCRVHPVDDGGVVERLVGLELVADRMELRLGHWLLARLRPGVAGGQRRDAFDWGALDEDHVRIDVQRRAPYTPL